MNQKSSKHSDLMASPFFLWNGEDKYSIAICNWDEESKLPISNIQISSHKNFYALREGVSATCTMKEDSELLEIPKLEKLQKCFVIVVLLFVLVRWHL